MREIVTPLIALARLSVIFHKNPEIGMNKLPCSPKHSLQRQALALAIASVITPVGARAADVYWNAITGNWADPNNWYAGVLPTALDNVYVNSVPIFDPDAIPATILTIDDASSAVNAAQAGNLYIDNFDPIQSLTLNQTGGNLSVNGAEYIGSAGVGSIQQSGGVNSTNRLIMGSQTGSSGSYTLSGGRLTVFDVTTIGDSYGQGSFTQNGGTHSIGNRLDLGGSNDTIATPLASSYALNAGILTARQEIIGSISGGDFIQHGGDNQITEKLTIGNGSSGSYTLSSGNLTAAAEVIGYLGSGLFNQSGGTHTINGALALGGIGSKSEGRYSLSGGVLAAQNVEIGGYGNGFFLQNGGEHRISGQLTVGAGAHSSSDTNMYELSGTGTLITDSEIIGELFNEGVFVQKGGSHQITHSLNIGSSGTYNMEGGTLTSERLNLGVSGLGKINQSGGSIVAQSQVNLSGTYNFSGGTLTTATFIKGSDNANFNWTGGDLHYTTDFNVTAGTPFFGDRFSIGTGRGFRTPNMTVAADGVVNQTGGNVLVDSKLTLNGRYTFGGGTLNVGGNFNSGVGGLTLAGGVLNNNGEVILAGGTLEGNQVNNYALVNGYGSISADNFTNYGLLTQGAGNLSLNGYKSYGYFENAGNMILAAGRQLQLSNNIGLYNYGSLDLNNAIVTGTGALENNSGGVISGRGTIASSFSNNGGMLVVESGTTRANDGFNNTGVVQLNSASANLAGGLISNGLLGLNWDEASQAYVQTWTGGTIQGYGQIASAVDNNPNSIIEARGGALTLTGAVSNTGTLAAGNAAKLLISQGLASNDGRINLEGGSFDNNNHTLINNGQINGHGTLRSGGLTNLGHMTLANGNTTINGAVTNGDINDTSAVLEVSHSQALFTDTVVNYGTFKNTSSSITFAAEYIENGLYYSDPAVNTFNSTVTVGESGYLLGGAGDEFHYKKDFIVHSLRDTDWNTDQAALFFDGGIAQNFYLAGADLGVDDMGFTNNYSWGSLKLGSGTTLSLLDGNATAGAALYVHDIFLTGVDYNNLIISSIFGSYNIYYDKDSSVNAYLNGATFNFAGGGKLIGLQTSAVPIPASAWLFGTALMTWLGVHRRREQHKLGVRPMHHRSFGI